MWVVGECEVVIVLFVVIGGLGDLVEGFFLVCVVVDFVFFFC